MIEIKQKFIAGRIQKVFGVSTCSPSRMCRSIPTALFQRFSSTLKEEVQTVFVM